MSPAAPSDGETDSDSDAEPDADDHRRADPFQQGEADQRPQPGAKPLPRFTDGDACAENGPADDHREHASQQDAREPGCAVAGEARYRRAEQHTRRHLLTGQRRREFTGDGQRTHRQDERENLRGHHHDGRQPQRRFGIRPDVGDGAIEDVRQAQRPQRNDARLDGLGNRRRAVSGRVAVWRVPGWGITGRRITTLRAVAGWRAVSRRRPVARWRAVPGRRVARWRIALVGGRRIALITRWRIAGRWIARRRRTCHRRTRRRRCSCSPSCRSLCELTTLSTGSESSRWHEKEHRLGHAAA